MIYFDNAATSYKKPNEVKMAVRKAVSEYTANPGRSGHNLSLKSARIVFETRERIKSFFNAKNYEVIFTKNCTEALNLAIFGLLEKGDHVITTTFEHNSVLRPLYKLKGMGVDVTILDCELNEFDKEIEKHIKPNTKLIIATASSNVTGATTNLKHIAEIAKRNGVLYLIDGAQACGHQNIDLEDIGADMLAFAGHKGLLSITGVGGLVVRNRVKLKPLLFGGTGTESENLFQPTNSVEGYEAGTLPTIAIASLNAGINFLQKNSDDILKIEQKLSSYLFSQLNSLSFLEIYSNKDSQNVFSFNIKSCDSMEVANILNERYNIAVRSGLHCAALTHKHLGTTKTGAIRVSLDFNNTKQEIDYLIFALKQINVMKIYS